MAGSTSHSVSSSSTVSAGDVNQFLTLHRVTAVYQGTNVLSSGTVTGTTMVGGFGGFEGFFQPSESYVDTTFTVASTATSGITVRLPITVNDVASQVVIDNALPPSLFEQAIDCTVMIVGDNGSGDPDLTNVYAKSLLPAEFIEATSLDAWPEPEEFLIGSNDSVWDSNTFKASVANSFEGVSEVVFTTAGNWAVSTGGFSGTNVINNAVVYAPYLNETLTGWRSGPNLPTPVAGASYIVESLPYAPTSTALIMTGCGYATSYGGALTNSNVCYTASFDQSGTIGTWQAQQPLPHNVSSCYSTVVTFTTSNGDQDYVLVFDVSRQNIYYAQVESGGTISTWATVSAQSIAAGQPFVLPGSYATFTNANGNTTSYATLALVNDAVGYVYSAIAALKPSGVLTFTPWRSTSTTSLNVPSAGGPSTLAGVLGSTITSSDHYSSLFPNFTALIAADPAFSNFTSNPLLFQMGIGGDGGPQGTNGGTWVFSNNDGTYSAFGMTYSTVLSKIITLSTKAWPMTWANVPMLLTSNLTPGTTYHLVLQFATSPGPSVGVNLAMTNYNPSMGNVSRTSSTGAPGSWSNIYSDVSSTMTTEFPWQLWSGSTLPGGVNGPLLALIDDITGRVSYVWIGPQTRQLLAAAEWTTDERACFLLEYDQTTSKLSNIVEVT